MTASTLFDAYLEINALLLIVCALCLLLGLMLRWAGLSHSVTAQLRLMRAGFLMVLASPVFLAVLAHVDSGGPASTAASLNLSEFVVSQYLQGRFDVEAAVLENVLGWRSALAQSVTGGANSLGLGVLALLGAGFVIYTARLVISMVKLSGMIADSYVWRRFGRLELRLSDTITVPFSTRSLRRRYVVVPSAMLANDSDLRIALAHELQHLRQGDVEWEIAMELLRPLLFWNPAFHIWKNRVERLRELACDRRVMARRGYDVAAYCQCLLRVCHNGLKRPRLFAVEAPVVALVRTENRLFAERSAALLRGRLVSLIEGRAERHPNMIFALMALPLLVLTLAASVAIQSPGDWSEDRIMLTTIVNLERLRANDSAPAFGNLGY